MKLNKLLEYTIYILLCVIIIYILNKQFKTLETFAMLEANSDNITQLMNDQLLFVKDLSETSANLQKNTYLPHFDVVNSYRNSSNKFLNSLKNQVNQGIEKKNEYLSRLDNTLIRLSQFKNDEFLKELKNTDFKTLKSHNNGMNLTINRIGFDLYQIKVNNGYLAVTPENDYYITNSNPKDKRQHFKLHHIFSETEYRNAMNKSFPQLINLGKVKYPFTFVKSVMTDNCLKNTHGKLSLEPCREYEGQRWASSKTIHNCNTLF
jgi:hypothetical protein